MFDDLLEANDRYRKEFHDPGVPGKAAKHLAVITCIDSRIDPLSMLGLRAGDAKIIRNAGGRLTHDALRSLIIAANLLEVQRVCVVQHTDCAMSGATEEAMRQHIGELRGENADDWNFLFSTDPDANMRADLQTIARCRLLPPDLVVGGFVFDVKTGALTPVA